MMRKRQRMPHQQSTLQVNTLSSLMVSAFVCFAIEVKLMNSRRSFRWFQLRWTVNCHSEDTETPYPNTLPTLSFSPSPPSLPFLSNATHQKQSIFAHVNRLFQPLSPLDLSRTHIQLRRQSTIACAGYSRTIHFPFSILFLVLVFPLWG